jgi:PAS domain S-box-containing protein
LKIASYFALAKAGLACLFGLLARLLCAGGLFLVPALADADWSPPQQAWLGSHSEIRVGLVEAPPLVQRIGGTARVRGLIPDYLTLLQSELGVRLVPVVFGSERELALHADDYDMLAGVEQSAEGLRRWIYTEIFLRQDNVIVAAAGRAATLGDETVLVLPGRRIAAFLQRNYPGIRLTETARARDALQLLQAGDAAMAVLDRAQAQFWLQMPEYESLRIQADAGYAARARLAVRQDWPELAEILDQALARLPREQTLALEKRWVGSTYREWWDRPALWGGIALLSLALAVLFGLMALKNRRLGEQTQSQLRQLENELNERHELTRALRHTQFSVDRSPVGVLRLGWNGRIQYANQAVCDLLGLEPENILASTLQQIDPQLAHNAQWLEYWNGLRRQHVRTYEAELCHGSSLIPVEIHACHQSFGDQEYVVLFMSDISERNRIRRALEESEARFRELANHVPGMVFQLRRLAGEMQPQLVYLSEACAQFCGYPAEHVLASGQVLREIIYPAELADFNQSLQTAISTDAPWIWQGRIVTARGEIRWADLKASFRRERGECIWDGMVWDITASKRIEQSLGESRLLLRELAAHHETLREREKASIAREVHDELGQILTAMKIETSVCELALAERLPEEAARIAGLKKLIDQTLQISRNVVTALRPPALDLGLMPALEWLTQRMGERLQLHCELEIDERVQHIDEGEAVILFRIVQEALTNVARHARASWVLIRIEYRDETLALRIEDDGIGFDPESISRTFGLVGIRERVWMLRGTLHIDSAPGAGTRILVSIPHSGEPHDSRPDR